MEMQLLSDICSFGSGRVNVGDLSVKNYISTENLQPNKGGLVDAAGLPAVKQVQAVNVDDVLVSNIRPYFKKIWHAREIGGCSNDVLVFRANAGVDTKFLYYVLADDRFFEYATASAKGTKMPRGDKKAIMQYSVPKLALEIQRKIGCFLRNIDDKIEINNAINKNLEEQIDVVWTEMFDGVEKDIELGSVIKTTSGGTPSRTKDEYYFNGDICWVKSKELNGTFITDTEEKITDLALSKSSAKILPEHSVLIAMYGATVGEFGIINKKMACNQAICALIPNESYPSSYLYCFAKSGKRTIINLAVGSAQQNISQVLIKQMKVHSTGDMIRKFDVIVNPMLKSIENNIKANLQLIQLRDTLLPKLMSGELDVSELDI